MSERPILGVGVIGLGRISDVYLHNLPLFPGLRLVACSGRSHEAARAKAANCGIEALSFDAMLRRDDIDIIVNLTPPQAHFGINLAALQAGKHVYSEKPLAIDAADGQRLVIEADARGLLLGCAPDTFLGAGARLARAMLDSGEIGAVLSGTGTMMTHGMEHWHPNPGFFFKAGGGPALDLGPYYLTTLVNLLGPVARVTAMSTTGVRERRVTVSGPNHGQRIAVEVPTTVLGILRFRLGADISLTLSWDVWRHSHPQIELYGIDGSMRLTDPNGFDGDVALAKEADDWQFRPSAAMPFGQRNWRPSAWPKSQPAMANYRGLGVAELARAATCGTPHRSSGRLAAHVLDVMQAMLISDGVAVDIASSPDRPVAMSEAEAASLLRPDSEGRKV